MTPEACGLPDSDGADVVPHPSGLAHHKACDECAFRTSDPQDIGDGYQSALRQFDGRSVFYCLHVLEDDCNRVCASYAAINRLPRLKA